MSTMHAHPIWFLILLCVCLVTACGSVAIGTLRASTGNPMGLVPICFFGQIVVAAISFYFVVQHLS